MNYNYDDIVASVNTGLKPMYLLYGDEQYFIEQLVKKIKKAFGELVEGINFINIDDTNLSTLISNIEMPSFGYDKKLIIVKNSGLFKKDGRKKTASPIQEEIANYIDNNFDTIEENCVLIFIEIECDKNTVFESVTKKAAVLEMKELNPAQLVSKLKNICSLYKVNASPDVLNYLVENCGTNMQILINEIRKLIEYAGPNGTITKDDVDALAIKTVESRVFDLSELLVRRKIKEAMELFDNLIYLKTPCQVIEVLLFNHFKKLYLCSKAIKFKKDIASSLDLTPKQLFLVNKYKEQLKYFKESDLRTILNSIADLDYQFKIGKIDIEVGLRAILCTYCS